jgi:hypothetical protein
LYALQPADAGQLLLACAVTTGMAGQVFVHPRFMPAPVATLNHFGDAHVHQIFWRCDSNTVADARFSLALVSVVLAARGFSSVIFNFSLAGLNLKFRPIIQVAA